MRGKYMRRSLSENVSSFGITKYTLGENQNTQRMILKLDLLVDTQRELIDMHFLIMIYVNDNKIQLRRQGLIIKKHNQQHFNPQKQPHKTSPSLTKNIPTSPISAIQLPIGKSSHSKSLPIRKNTNRFKHGRNRSHIQFNEPFALEEFHLSPIS